MGTFGDRCKFSMKLRLEEICAGLGLGDGDGPGAWAVAEEGESGDGC